VSCQRPGKSVRKRLQCWLKLLFYEGYVVIKKKRVKMTDTQEIFLKCLRQFVNSGRNHAEVNCQNVKCQEENSIHEISIHESLIDDKEIDFNELDLLMRWHHVLPIVVEVLSDSVDYEKIPDELWKKWKKESRRLVAIQFQKNYTCMELCEKMKKAGIRFCVIKGIQCQVLYKKPELRTSKDMDILVNEQDLEVCNDFLVDEGFKPKNILDERAYESSYYNPNNNVVIDVHRSLLPIGDNIILENLLKATGEVNTFWYEGHCFAGLEDTVLLFYLISHAEKHFIISGFGIRQLLDILMVAREKKNNIKWDCLFEMVEKTGMSLFVKAMFQIGDRYLGFSEEYRLVCDHIGECVDCGNLLWDILDAGSFGKTSTGRMHSVHVTKGIAAGESRIKIVRKALFPDIVYMRRQFSYVDRHPWLLPVSFWHRIIRYLKEKGDGGVKNGSLQFAKKRSSILKQYGIKKLKSS
jgi:hypothetical protein